MSLYSDEYPDFEKARWYLTSMRKKKPHITALNYNSAMLSQLDFAVYRDLTFIKQSLP